MSNEKAIIVGDTKIHGNVGGTVNSRSEAVEIALEMIKSACAGCGPIALSDAMKKLSGYADTIESALKK